MLPPFIIEQIRRREETRKEQQQPQLEIPLPPKRSKPLAPEFDADRGVLIIDLMGDDD